MLTIDTINSNLSEISNWVEGINNKELKEPQSFLEECTRIKNLAIEMYNDIITGNNDFKEDIDTLFIKSIEERIDPIKTKDIIHQMVYIGKIDPLDYYMLVKDMNDKLPIPHFPIYPDLPGIPQFPPMNDLDSLLKKIMNDGACSTCWACAACAACVACAACLVTGTVATGAAGATGASGAAGVSAA